MLDPGSRSDKIDSPGASTSTSRSWAPPLVNAATSSSAVDTVPLVAVAPTAITNGSVAGSLSVGAVLPSLPAAATTTIPAFQACSTANCSGSVQAAGSPPLPYERLITRIGLAGSLVRFCTTQSMPAITWETSTAPLAVPSFTEVSLTPGAMPLVPLAVSLPTMMPAMCVPCP